MNEHFDSKPNDKIVKSAKIMHLCSAVVFLLAGILVAFFPMWNNPTSLGEIIVGIASIVIGTTGVFGYFSNDMYRLAFQSDFALGIFNIIFGVLLIINPDKFPVLLPTAIAILTLLDGGNKSQIAIEGQRFGISKWYLVLLSALIEIVMGVVLLILAYLNVMDVHVFMGVTMGVVGATNFWTTMYTVRIRGKSSNLTDK